MIPPSRRVDGLTPEIDRVVLKAMDRSPNRRPLTMRQFLADVAALMTALFHKPLSRADEANPLASAWYTWPLLYHPIVVKLSTVGSAQRYA